MAKHSPISASPDPATPGLRRISVTHDGTWIVRLESLWDGGREASHGGRMAQEEGLKTITLHIPEGEEITKVGLRCKHGARNTHIIAIIILVSEGRPLGPGWIGGSGGEVRWLQQADHRVVGFVGRAGSFVEALGVIWEPVHAVATPFRSPVYGAPSGLTFEDMATADTSQVSTFVLRQAFRKGSSSEGMSISPPLYNSIAASFPERTDTQVSVSQTQTSQLLEAARDIFRELRDAAALHPKGLPALYAEFESHFGAVVRYTDRTRFQPARSASDRDMKEDTLARGVSDTQTFKTQVEFRWDPFAEYFILSPCRLYASCQVSAGWRTTWCEHALPLQDDVFAVQVSLVFEELRVAILGLRVGQEPPDSGSYVGDSPEGVGYQSTGHLLSCEGGEKKLVTVDPFQAKDRIDLLVTRKHCAYYRNGKNVGHQKVPVSGDGGLYIAFSSYLGPNTARIVDQKDWKVEVADYAWPPASIAIGDK